MSNCELACRVGGVVVVSRALQGIDALDALAAITDTSEVVSRAFSLPSAGALHILGTLGDSIEIIIESSLCSGNYHREHRKHRNLSLAESIKISFARFVIDVDDNRRSLTQKSQRESSKSDYYADSTTTRFLLVQCMTPILPL